MKAWPIPDLKVIYSDELLLTGKTFGYGLELKYSDDSKVTHVNVTIHVPNAFLNEDSRSKITSCNILVFFCASYFVDFSDAFNDTLNYGARKIAETNNYIVIFVPGAEKIDTPPPSFRYFGDIQIEECLAALELKLKIDKIRLASHSRGHRGLTSTLLGNRNFKDPDLELYAQNIVKKNQPLINLTKVDKIFYLDNFYKGAYYTINHLLTEKKITKKTLKVFHCIAGGVMQPDLFIDSISKQYLRINSFRNVIILIAFFRAIELSGDLEATYIYSQNKSEVTAKQGFFKNLSEDFQNKYKKLDGLNIIPLRGLFTSVNAENKIPFDKFCTNNLPIFKKIYDLRDNSPDVLIMGAIINKIYFGKIKLNLEKLTHHFFVAEFAHEFFE